MKIFMLHFKIAGWIFSTISIHNEEKYRMTELELKFLRTIVKIEKEHNLFCNFLSNTFFTKRAVYRWILRERSVKLLKMSLKKFTKQLKNRYKFYKNTFTNTITKQIKNRTLLTFRLRISILMDNRSREYLTPGNFLIGKGLFGIYCSNDTISQSN